MNSEAQAPRRRGRPPRQREDLTETRELLLRAGLEVLTEKGFSATGIDEILGRVSVPKELRDYAGLEREAVWLGVVDNIELWSKARYDELRRRHAEEDQAKVREYLARHGL